MPLVLLQVSLQVPRLVLGDVGRAKRRAGAALGCFGSLVGLLVKAERDAVAGMGRGEGEVVWGRFGGYTQIKIRVTKLVFTELTY